MEYPFEKLEVWQLGMQLVQQVYCATQQFPKDEQFGITSQIRRAAVSVPLNIAEGKGRFHTKSFIQFLYQARGSLFEVITLIKLSEKLKYFKEKKEVENILVICDSLTKKINALVSSMKEPLATS